MEPVAFIGRALDVLKAFPDLETINRRYAAMLKEKGSTMKTVHEDIFKAIEDDPAVAENLRLRAQMMALLRDTIKAKGLTQTAAAELFGVSQPRISDLTRGKIERFKIDMLVNMLARAGIFLEVEIRRAA